MPRRARGPIRSTRTEPGQRCACMESDTAGRMVCNWMLPAVTSRDNEGPSISTRTGLAQGRAAGQSASRDAFLQVGARRFIVCARSCCPWPAGRVTSILHSLAHWPPSRQIPADSRDLIESSSSCRFRQNQSRSTLSRVVPNPPLPESPLPSWNAGDNADTATESVGEKT